MGNHVVYVGKNDENVVVLTCWICLYVGTIVSIMLRVAIFYFLGYLYGV
jgi:hypothetical protein